SPGRPRAVRPGQPRRGLPRRRPALRADRGGGPGRGGRGRRRGRLTRGGGSCARSRGPAKGPGARMDVVQPLTWPEALAARAEQPDLLPIAGGTDVMVDINFGRRRPAGLLDLTRIDEIATWSVEDGIVRIGAGVTYAQVESDLAGLAPGLAM